MFHFFLIGVLSVALVYTNVDAIQKRYQKLKSLYSLVKTHHSQIRSIIWVMMCIIAKTMYLSIIQYFNNTLVQKDKNTYELTYTVAGSIYKMLIRVKRGPKKLINAFDHDGKDVTEIILSYLGPNEDFHHAIFTPDYFDKESITFHLSDGEEKSFTRFQPLLI